MNELKYYIESLENNLERLEQALDHASTQGQAELIEARMIDIQERLETARADYEAQMVYDGLNDWQYNGVRQQDFYNEY